MELRYYQKELLAEVERQWALGRNRVVVMSPTGSGKSLTLAEAIRKHNGVSCAIAHRDNLVIQLSLSLAERGVRHRIIASQKTQRAAAAQQAKKIGKVWIDPGAKCAVASAQTLAKRDELAKWAASVTLYVVDECFPAGTMVGGKPIETLRVGDYVTAFNEVDGSFHKRRVTRLFKNPMPDYMVSLRFWTHHVIDATLSHPFWTKRGWVSAVDLTEDDEVLIDLQLVQKEHIGTDSLSGVPTKVWEERVLRSSLLKGVSQEKVIGDDGKDQYGSCVRTDETKQSYGSGRNQRENDADNAFKRHSTPSAGRQREAFTSGRSEPSHDVRGFGFHGSMQYSDQDAEGQRLSDMLQGGLRERDFEIGNRSGRNVTLDALPSSAGSQERRVFEWVRLDSVEVYEPRDSGTARSGSRDGYVYNIEVEEFHTYVANGVVVHNCHHLTKGSVWGRCVERFTHPQCRALLPTATPGRADGKGLGSHHDGYADVLVALVEDGDRLAVRVAMPQESITCAPAKVLMDQGFLTRYKVAIAQTHLERFLGEVGPSGDWTPAALKKAAAQTNMVGDVVDSYKQFAMGLTAIVFARDVEEAGNIAKAYRAEGISAEVLTGETDPAVRMSIFARLESGALKVVVAVDVISEGTDIPAVGAIIFARATASLGLFLQMVGRGLRPAPGKQNCIARGTPILTQRGPVPIEDIALTDRVWDGIDFVSHKGAICNGVRPTITYLGLTATPDHLVWTQEGWRTFGDCAREQIAIAQTGLGGETIRERENLFARGGVAQVETVRLLPVRDLLGREVASLHEPDGRSDQGLSSVQSADTLPPMVLCAGPIRNAKVQQPEQRPIRFVRRSGDQVQFPECDGGGFVDSRQSGDTGESEYAVGQDRQRRPLRTGEYPLVNTAPEHVSSDMLPGNGQDARVSVKVPGDQVRGFDASSFHVSADDGCGNHNPVLHPIEQTEREVWDILDAGPRNRFTAQGLLVHNCVLIDHVGNVLRHRGGPDTPRTWSLSRRDKRAPAVRDAIPLRVCLNIDCMQPYEKHLDACPYCGQPAPEPERRGPPEAVEGVLSLMDEETLARLRGEMPATVEEYSREQYGSGLPGRFAGRNVRQHKEWLEVLDALKEAMAVWAGPHHAAGLSDTEIQRLWWLTYQCDIWSAQQLPKPDALKLLDRLVTGS